MLNTSLCAFSTSSNSTTEYGRRLHVRTDVNTAGTQCACREQPQATAEVFSAAEQQPTRSLSTYDAILLLFSCRHASHVTRFSGYLNTPHKEHHWLHAPSKAHRTASVSWPPSS